MKHAVYLRPLELEDAKISYKWRNDPDVWKYTEARPDRHITYHIEKEWLEGVLKRRSERRFAICLKGTDRYIGNIQLLGIQRKNARFHLFIGNKTYWGKGIAKEASSLILRHAFTELDLRRITLEVHKDNLPARSVYQRMGFVQTEEKGDFMVMMLTRSKFINYIWS
ncbi:MAG: GNAT family N-acetyltransferase [Arcticibacter sp.]